jgi:2-succinyl-6-hydroxy-2,4-cyclohexadiene-1-carboxylate synthase
MEHPLLNHTLAPSGHAPTVLYLHGFLGCKDDWSEVVNLLGSGFSHLTVDLPGHRMPARSLPLEYYSLPGCAELIVRLLNHLQIEHCHLVAYSMGGRLALYLLTHYSDRFLSAVIESATAGLRTEAERSTRLQQEQFWITRLRERTFDEFLNDWYVQPLFNTIDRNDPRFKELMERRRSHDPAALALSLEHMGTGVMSSLWDKFPGITIPLLFVAGERDEKYCSLAREMASLCPDAQAAIIANAGHNAHFECPVAFGETVVQFLKQNV